MARWRLRVKRDRLQGELLGSNGKVPCLAPIAFEARTRILHLYMPFVGIGAKRRWCPAIAVSPATLRGVMTLVDLEVILQSRGRTGAKLRCSAIPKHGPAPRPDLGRRVRPGTPAVSHV